ncbi:hypothetical protein IQ256_13250 [cf. Phormidesmis sp. LEGE 11477]|nr:hypothetical protein [cf. Phormidesmis sp. LEGE 11477]
MSLFAFKTPYQKYLPNVFAMSLPIVLEIAVGLIFIYLTLSLVASEIQEILSALFQWRAEHLKRSIEQLLAGDSVPHTKSAPPEDNREAARVLADKLYGSPLIENLNYEAQGRGAAILRRILHGVGAAYRTVTFSRNVFGDRTSGPSYIPSEAFATSLIDRLKLKDFQQILMRSRFSTFLEDEVIGPLHNIVNELRARLQKEDLMDAELVYFEQSVNQIAVELTARRLPLDAAVDQVLYELQAFETRAANASLADLGANAEMIQTFLSRIRYLRMGLSGHAETNELLLAKLRPSLADLTDLLNPNSPTYAELVALAQKEGGAIRNALEKLQEEVIPPQLQESLATLATRAETRVDAVGTELQQLQTEVETWFDNGMERAAGVYRRNVKGVGLMVGLAIAFILNADTLYMFNRLSTNQAVRSSIVQTADQLDIGSLESAEALAAEQGIDDLSDTLVSELRGDLRSVGLAVEESLADYPLPIGRTQKIFRAQQIAEDSWPVPVIPRRLVGWGITALALSMGASFWFDLLRKVMSVRASGEKPRE